MNSVDDFTRYRRYLFAIAYRMLGSAMDAEDMVQETYLRWSQAEGATVQSPKAYLATIITRLCIDRLRSAQAQREVYVGTWLPEPVPAAALLDPDEKLELDESLSIAFLVLLERLSPVERAVYLLHEVFAYSFVEIAEIVGKSEANCRQMASRARKHIRQQRPRFNVSRHQHEQVLHQFISTCTHGDMNGLLALLAKDAVLRSDSGGKAPAALNPIHGADHVARFLFGVLRKAPAHLEVRISDINGQPALLAFQDGQLWQVWNFDIEEGRIQHIDIILNPGKLHAVQASVQ